MKPSIELSHVTLSHGRAAILGDLCLTLQAGRYGVLVGGSGSGKTTLLRVIAGLQPPDFGIVSLAGVDQTKVSPHQRDVTMVFQNDGLYPHWTIRQTLAQSIRHVRDKQERLRLIAETGKRFGIEDWLDRPPREVSGGQLRRAALANAMIRRPSVVLLDEPLSALDGEVRGRMIDVLGNLPRDRGNDSPPTSVLHVTHDGNEAMRLADCVFVLAAGKIAQSGPPGEVYASPLTVSAALALGSPAANCLPLGNQGFPASDFGFVQKSFDRPEVVVVRPESIRIDEATENDRLGWRWEAVVTAVHFAGSHAHVRLQPATVDHELTASIPWTNVSRLPPIGSSVKCFVPSGDYRLVADDRSVTMGE